MRLTLLVASYSLAAVLAAPLEGRSDYAIHSTHFVPDGWTKGSKPHAEQMLKIRIGLKQASFESLEKELFEVSDPNHNRYGQHLTQSEIHAHTAPSAEVLDAVHQWLEGHDILAHQLEYSEPKVSIEEMLEISPLHSNLHPQDWIIVSLPVAKVEQLLDTEYHQYQHTDGAQVIRTTQYSLPRSLQQHVDIVAPTK